MKYHLHNNIHQPIGPWEMELEFQIRNFKTRIFCIDIFCISIWNCPHVNAKGTDD